MSGTQSAFTTFLTSGCPATWTSPFMTTRAAANWPTAILPASSSSAAVAMLYNVSATFVPYAIAFADYASGAFLNARFSVRRCTVC